MPIWCRSSQPGTDHETMRCVVDERGNVVFASPAVGWSLGVSADTLLSKPAASILDIISSYDSQHQALDFSNISSGFYEVALLRKERDPLLLQARIDRVDSPTGRKYTVIWLDPDSKLKREKECNFNQAAHDFAHFILDNQKKTGETSAENPSAPPLPKEDGELSHFLGITSDLLGVCRSDGSFIRVNHAFNRVLGYSDADLQVLPFINLIYREDRDAMQSALLKMQGLAADQNAPVNLEGRAYCKNGGIRWMKWALKAVEDHVYIVGCDVTGNKQHETELLRREEQLSEAQKIGRMGHWYWEVGQKEMEWSDQIYPIFGVEKGKFTPTIENINALMLKRDAGKIYKAFQQALATKEDYELQFQLRRSEDGLRFIHCEGRCKINLRTGEVEALFGIMQDITERTLHERALHEAKEAAETAYASKTRFLANMSHELRTPLNAIIGFSEMIQRQLLGPVGNSKYLGYVGDIRKSGEYLLDLINDILDMSKIEAGKYEIHAEEINVGKLIRQALYMVEGRAEEAQIRLITDDIPDDVHITADRRALRQVILNILTNAIKFTNPEGSVEISCQHELGGVAITIADTGIGIPQDKLDTVTMPFEQVDSELTRKHDGSGLGLTITKDLIGLHGGTLHIASEVGVGTVVTVLLPEKLSRPEQAERMQEAAV